MLSTFRDLVSAVRHVFAGSSRGEDPARANYKALLERVKRGDPTADLAELRLAFAASPEYTSDANPESDSEMQDALDAKQYARAIAAAEKVLADCYVDIDAHQVLYLAHRETNDVEKAKFHRNMVQGLIDSILQSGDGKGEATAYVVISTAEEYVILNVKGLRLQRQSLVPRKHHEYDVMEVVNEQGGNETVYFNIDMPMAQLRRSLGH